MASSILHQSSWAQSALGKSIEMYRSQPGTAPLLFIGGVHGDEPEGVELASKFLSWLQINHNSNFHPWILIPCLNVDGYSINQRVNGNGVDLNRNFPSRDWSPEIKAPRYNPGSAPCSEPEIKALCSLIAAEKPVAIVHFHSWEPCVVYTGTNGRVWAEMAAGNSGYVVREDIGYPTPGSLGQFGLLNLEIPVVCIEEQEGCPLPEIWPRFQSGLIKMVQK